MAIDGIGSPSGAPPPSTPTANRPTQPATTQQPTTGSRPRATAAASQTLPTSTAGEANNFPSVPPADDALAQGAPPPRGSLLDILV